MKPLKYKVIKDNSQYKEYCDILAELKDKKAGKKKAKEYIDLLDLLTRTWESKQNTFDDQDPVVVLRSCMDQHSLKSKDLVGLLGVSKGLVSDMLNYKKGFSKEIIRTLSTHFNISQEAFNRPYSRTPGKSEIVYE